MSPAARKKATSDTAAAKTTAVKTSTRAKAKKADEVADALEADEAETPAAAPKKKSGFFAMCCGNKGHENA